MNVLTDVLKEMFPKLFNPKDSLPRKVANIKHDIKTIVKKYCEEKFWIDCYGAYDIDPKYLVFLICVRTDKVKEALKANDELNNLLRNLLVEHEYPVQAYSSVIIDYESQETVDRDSNGQWAVHLK